MKISENKVAAFQFDNGRKLDDFLEALAELAKDDANATVSDNWEAIRQLGVKHGGLVTTVERI